MRDTRGTSDETMKVLVAILIVTFVITLIFLYLLWFIPPGEPVDDEQTGSIALINRTSGDAEINFGRFNPTPDARDVNITIRNGTLVSYYRFNASSKAFEVLHSDSANTGTSMEFIDLMDDQRVNVGDYCEFSTSPGFMYEVSVFIESEVICSGTLWA